MDSAKLAEVMKNISQDAVAFAQKQNIALDFSSESIHSLELLLDTMHNQIASANPSPELFAKFANMFGAYLGETFIRNVKKGEWKVKEDMNAITVYIDGTYLFFPAKVYRRLKDGEADNVEYMYKIEFEKYKPN